MLTSRTIAAMSLVALTTVAFPAWAQTQTITGAAGGDSDRQVVTYGGIQNTPWFADTNARKELQLTDQQYEELNRAYQRAYQDYARGLKELDPNLAGVEARERRRALANRFYQDFSQSAETVFRDPQNIRRYNQLDLQYRGYNAFHDPLIREKLDLTDEQRQKFNNYEQDWNTKMARLYREYPNDPDRVMKNFNENRMEYQNNLKTVFTPSQRRAWETMIGHPYEFTPDVYFGTTSTTVSKPELK